MFFFLQLTAATLLLVYSTVVIIHNVRSPWLTPGSMQSDFFYFGLMADALAGALTTVSLIAGRPFGVHATLLAILVSLRASSLTYRIIPVGNDEERPTQYINDGLIRLGLTFTSTSSILALLDEPEFPSWTTNTATCLGTALALATFLAVMYERRAINRVKQRVVKGA